MKFEWEDIKNLPSFQTYRAKVFGGWIVNNCTQSRESETNNPILMTESSVFVPDPKHEWIVD